MTSQAPSAFKAIFTFQDFTKEIGIPDLSLLVSLAESSKLISLPFKEGLLLETKEILPSTRVQLQLEDGDGDIVGYAELRIPSSVFSQSETEVNQQVQFQLVKGQRTSFVTTISVIFLKKEKNSVVEALRLQELRAIATSPKKLLVDATSPKKPTSPQRQRSVEVTSPASRKDGPPVIKKEAPEQDAISQLIQLNRNEKNLPNSFFDDSALIQLQKELESPYSKGSTGPSSTSPKKFRRSETVSTENKDARERNSKSKDASPGPLFRTQVPNFDIKRHTPNEDADKMKILSKLSFLEPVELSDDKQLSEVLNTLEKDLAGQIYFKPYIDYLRNKMLTMEFKNNEIEAVRNENEALRQDIQRLEENRIQAQGKTSETIRSLKQENEDLTKKIDNMFVQQEALNKKNQELQNEVIKAKENASKTSLALVQKNNELSEASIKLAELTEIKYHLKRAQDALIRGEEQRADDQKNYMTALASLRKSLEENKLSLEKTFQEKREIALLLAQEKFSHQDTRNELVLVEKKLHTADGYKETIKSMEVQREEISRQLSESRTERDEVQKLVEKAQQNLTLKMREFEAREGEYITKITVVEENNKATEVKNVGLIRDINTANIKILQLSTQIQQIGPLKDDKEELNKEVIQLKERLTQAIQERSDLAKEAEILTENHDKMNQKTFELERTREGLIGMIAEKDQETMGLREALAEALNQPLPDLGPRYIPVKDDPVDIALANYLNSHKEAAKYKMLFLRESEGVYQFGTKKIYIKIEGDKILIRVGGGYMTLEELLDTIAPGEYTKIAKYVQSDDPNVQAVAKNMSINKVIAGKYMTAIEKARAQARKIGKIATVINAMKGGADLGSPSNQRVDIKDALSPKSNRIVV